MSDDRIAEVMEIGQRNASVMPLIKNWCAHTELVVEGGVGLVEQMSGLPIAARRVTCKHERARGQSSMHLESNALDFHDRNCVGCTHRNPIGLPNLSKLVQERDDARAVAAAERAEQQARLDKELQRRQDRRRAVRAEAASRAQVSPDQAADQHAVCGLIDLIEALDSDPSGASSAALVESLRAVPLAFTPDVVALIEEITLAGGELRTNSGLKVLRALNGEERRLYTSSIAALRRGDSTRVAAGVVQDLASTQHEQGDDRALEEALASLIWIARPHREIFQMEEPACPEPFLAAQKLIPGRAEIAVRRFLRHDDKEFRRAGAYAVHALVRTNRTDDALSLVPDLIAGFSLPDDHYMEGEAGKVIAWVLAELLQEKNDKVDRMLRMAAASGDHDARKGVLRTYCAILDERDDSGWRIRSGSGEAAPSDSERNAFSYIIETLALLPADDELLREGAQFLQYSRSAVVCELAAESIAPLLGIVAMAIAEHERPQSTADSVDPRPSEIKALDLMARRSVLESVARAAIATVIRVAREHPLVESRKAAMIGVVEMADAVSDHSEVLAAELIAVMGDLPSDAIGVSQVLPSVYGAMTSRSVRVRAAAANAYVGLAKTVGAESLPSLLHESLLVLLSDPYIMVHDAAIHALDHVRIPDEYLARAFGGVINAIKAHAKQGHSRTLAKAIWLALHIAARLKPVTPKFKNWIVGLIDELSFYEADDFVRRGRGNLRDAEGYGELVLKLIRSPEAHDVTLSDLIEEFSRLPRSEIARLADETVGAAQLLVTREFWRADQLATILAAAGAWTQASKVARIAVEHCGSSRDQLPRRLKAEWAEAALQVEAGTRERNATAVIAAVRRVRSIETAIKADNEENKNFRGIFAPIR